MTKKTFENLDELIDYVVAELRPQIVSVLTQPKGMEFAAILALVLQVEGLVDISKDFTETRKISTMIAYEAVERLRYPVTGSQVFEEMGVPSFVSDNPDIADTGMEVPASSEFDYQLSHDDGKTELPLVYRAVGVLKDKS